MDTYHAIVMDTFDTVCNVKNKIGGKYLSYCHAMDGHKYVCMDELMSDIRNDECLVYSFGIGGDWTFEDTMADFGCTVYAYDPTIDHPEFHNDNIRFAKIGLVGEENNNKLIKL